MKPKIDDIDTKRVSLLTRAKALRLKRIIQLGELVSMTGAAGLDVDTLTGALLAAGSLKDPDLKEAWRREGAAFFHRRSRTKRSADCQTLSDQSEPSAQTGAVRDPSL